MGREKKDKEVSWRKKSPAYCLPSSLRRMLQRCSDAPRNVLVLPGGEPGPFVRRMGAHMLMNAVSATSH